MNTSEWYVRIDRLLLLIKITEQSDKWLTYNPIDLQKEDILEALYELNIIYCVKENDVIYYQYIKPSETRIDMKEERNRHHMIDIKNSDTN